MATTDRAVARGNVAIGQRLRRLAGVRDDEMVVVWRIAAVFGLLEVGRALGDAGAGGLLINREPGLLPGLFIPLGILSMAIAIGFGAALSRVRRSRLLAGSLLAIGGLLVVEWVALSSGAQVIAIVWLTVSAAGTLAMTIGWTVAGSSLDARQAKRLFPLCTSAAIVGYMLGSLAAGWIAGIIGSASLIVVEAVLFVLAAAVIASLARRSTGSGWHLVPAAGTSVVADVLVGFDEVRRSPLLRLIGVAYVLLAVLLFSVSYPYWLAARAVFTDEAELTAVLGLVSAVATGLSLVVALLVANRFYARFGVATAALLLPIVYLGGFAVWVVRLTFPTAAAVTVVQQITQRGLSNAAWSAFYNVVPASRRAQVLAFMDGVPGQLGTVLSGVLLLTVGRILAPDQVAWLGLGTALVAVVVVLAIRRRYADALVRTLRSGIGEQLLEGGQGPGDMLAVPEVRRALADAMAAPEPAIRSLATSMLARSDAPDARVPLTVAIDDPDPAVAAEAIVGILRVGMAPGDPVGTPGPVARAERRLAALLGGDETARVIGLRALHRLGRRPAPDLQAALLSDPSTAVRAMGLAILADDPDPAAGQRLVAALGDPLPLVRRAAATGLAVRPELPPGVIERLQRGTDDEQDAAIRALEGHAEVARDAVLAWAEAAVDRARGLHQARAVVVADAPGGYAASARPDEPGSADVSAFLARALDRRIERQHERVLAAMAVLGAPSARGVIRRSLRSTDADVRAQALEALDSVGDRRLGSALTRLIEGAASGQRLDDDTAWRRLRDDVDPWIRGLSRLCGPSGGPMPDPERALGDIETMLRLRRVPLFERLAPEDLQRLAAVATERWFEPGEVLVREGEPGDELFVILDGQVAVTRLEPDGSERPIRTYGAGDHIGELAVLRDRPRAATVTATGGRVRTLVIGGEGLTAILLERPEAAMAMLATLAERISFQ
jgi:HEAT repeat protein